MNNVSNAWVSPNRSNSNYRQVSRVHIHTQTHTLLSWLKENGIIYRMLGSIEKGATCLQRDFERIISVHLHTTVVRGNRIYSVENKMG